MKKRVLFTIALLLTLAQGAWATAYQYYIAEKNGQTLTFKGTNTEPNGTNQWLISSHPLDTWNDDAINNYTKVVFDSSFDEARPTSIAAWFETMLELESIEGMVYLHTDSVTDMSFAFAGSEKLTELNLIYFNTSKVENMLMMFADCVMLTTIYVGDGWDTSSLVGDKASLMLFLKCPNLVGEDGVTCVDPDDNNTWTAAYAHTGPGGYLTSEDAYWETHVAEDFWEVDGNTITINNKGEMELLAQEVNAGHTTYADKTFLLNKDLDYKGTENYYTRIGDTNKHCFDGIFDGQGHTISGINISGTGRQALFGTVGAGTVKNLTLDNSTIVNTNNSLAAGIAANISNGGTIENCHVTKSVSITGEGHVGGIVASTYINNISILGCTSAASVKTNSSNYSVGGIIGMCGYEGASSNSADVTIENCLYYGTSVSGSGTPTGAIVGQSISNPYSTITFASNFYTYPNADIKAIGQQTTRVGSGSANNTYNVDLSNNHGAVRARVVTEAADIADMGSQNGATYTDGIAIHEDGATFNNNFYSHVISLDEGADNNELVETYKDMTFDVVLRGSQMPGNGKWQTICLPFDASTQAGPLHEEGVEVCTLDSYAPDLLGNTLTLYFSKASGTITGGTPFVIKCANEELANPIFRDVTISNTFNDKSINLGNGKAITFKGSYAPVDFTEADRTMLLLDADQKLAWPEAGTHLGAQQACFMLQGFKAGTPEGIHDYLLKFNNEEVTGEFVISDDVATGIDNAALVNNNQNGWYTLDGRKLGNMPAQKGLYIVNGKKTVVK